MQGLLPTEAYRSRAARRAHGAAVGCLLLSILLTVLASQQASGWSVGALFTLALGALAAFWLACLSCLLHRTTAALCLLWTTLLGGLIVTWLIPRL